MKTIYSALYCCIVAAATQNASAFSDFMAEAQRNTENIGCVAPKSFPPSGGTGFLYSCVTGKAQTVKLYINEVPNNNKVKNVKLMWNDYTQDMGYGIHTDAKIAKAWAASVATMYASQQVAEVTRAFMGRKNTTIESQRYLLTYTYSQGPAIGEHLLTITERVARK